jgi:hypothetical protein
VTWSWFACGVGFFAGVGGLVLVAAWLSAAEDRRKEAAKPQVPDFMPDYLPYDNPELMQTPWWEKPSGRRVYDDDHPFID